MAAGEADFRAAKEAVTDAETLKRIRRWEMSLRYIRLVLYPELYETEQLRAMIRTFVLEMKELGISKVHEGGTWETSERVICDRIRARLPEFTME